MLRFPAADVWLTTGDVVRRLAERRGRRCRHTRTRARARLGRKARFECRV